MPLLLAFFILEDALSVLTNLGKHLLFVWLFVCSIKTGTRLIIRLDKLFSVVRHSRQTTEDNPQTDNNASCACLYTRDEYQTNSKCLSKFIQMDNATVL